MTEMLAGPATRLQNSVSAMRSAKPDYHKLKRTGRGPVEMRDGETVRISAEAELEWQRALAQPTAEHKAQPEGGAAKGALGRSDFRAV